MIRSETVWNQHSWCIERQKNEEIYIYIYIRILVKYIYKQNLSSRDLHGAFFSECFRSIVYLRKMLVTSETKGQNILITHEKYNARTEAWSFVYLPSASETSKHSRDVAAWLRLRLSSTSVALATSADSNPLSGGVTNTRCTATTPPLGVCSVECEIDAHSVAFTSHGGLVCSLSALTNSVPPGSSP